MQPYKVFVVAHLLRKIYGEALILEVISDLFALAEDIIEGLIDIHLSVNIHFFLFGNDVLLFHAEVVTLVAHQ